MATPGAVLGEMALNRPAVHGGTAVALEAVSGYEMDADEFRLLRKLGHPAAQKVLLRLARALCVRVRSPTQPADGGAPPGEARSPLRRRPPARERWDLLRACAFFEGLEDGELRRLFEAMQEVDLAAGETLFAAGEAEALFVVGAGTVEVTLDRGSHRHRLAVLGPGKVLGELSLLEGGVRNATCAARENVVLLELRLLDPVEQRHGGEKGCCRATNNRQGGGLYEGVQVRPAHTGL